MDERAPEDLRTAYEARGRLLAAQRWALADRVDDLSDEVRALREEVRWLENIVAERDRELARIKASRSFRISQRVGRILRRR